MKRFTLMLAGVLCASASFATDYYVSVDGSGEKSGSSWENAIAFTEMCGKINEYQNGDVFYFQGGTYYVPAKVPTVSNGYSFIGATTGTPTVFSGDVNGDGVANEGDASSLLFIQLATKNGDDSKHFVLKNITFTGAYVNQTKTSALRVDNSGWVDVQNCIFDKNISVYSKDNNYGGPACLLERSTVNFTDCKFINNESKGRGGAIKLTSDASTKGYTTLNRCLVSGNTASSLGSAIFLNHGQELNIINSVITENKSGTEGEIGAIFSIGAEEGKNARRITIINSTIAGNIGGAQVLGRNNADIRIANSIIVGDGTTSAISLQDKPKQVLSNGYNIIGMYKVGTAPTSAWKTSDFVSDDNTLSSIFGSNAVINGPVAAPYGATQVQMEAIAKGWSLGQDLKQDINGASRGDIAVPGAVVAEPLKGNFEITDAKYATYYHDFGYIMPEGVKGGVVTDAKVEGTLDVDYKYGSGSVVPAKSALLLNGAKNDYEVALKLEETTEDVNLLKGTSDKSKTTSDEADAKFYKFANDKDKGIGFYWGADNGAAFDNSANKAYLVVAGEASAAKGFALGGVDTGIKEVTEVGKMAGKIYNLQGMQQKGLQKGICIVNGKKFVVK